MKPANLKALGIDTKPGAMNIPDGRCWVCPAVAGLEDHHIIPRHCGGEDGPQVRLCGVCHTAIHNLANNKKVLAQEIEPLEIHEYNKAWSDALMLRKGHALAYVIAKSNKVTKGDANRKVKFATTFDGPTSRQLKQLKKSMGCTSLDQTIVALIKQAHGRLFRG
ncbi:hypothetical protein Peetri_00208 [Pseudomonas phage vB_PpuM-Peetri]